MLLDLLRRWLWGEAVQTRLSSDEAIAIARKAAHGQPMVDELQMTHVDVRSGRPVWVVKAPVIGSNLVVLVDDDTGEVLEVKRVFGR